MVEISLGTVIVIGIIIFGLFWVNENKPELLDDAKDKIGDVINKETTQQTEPITEGDKINYGKPYTPFECTSDVQCKGYFTEIDGIKCDLITGECYVGG